MGDDFDFHARAFRQRGDLHRGARGEILREILRVNFIHAGKVAEVGHEHRAFHDVGKGEFFQWIDEKTGKTKRQPKWYADAFMFKKEHGTERSKTFPGIAKAMAQQWG
jgi:hypothetical protein